MSAMSFTTTFDSKIYGYFIAVLFVINKLVTFEKK